MDAVALYEEALAKDGSLAGHYNRNVRVEAASGPVVVRTRSGAGDAMDLTLWPEAELLAAIGPYVPSAPRLMHVGVDPDFQIHEFVEGRRIDDLAPDGSPLPPKVRADIEGFFGRLLRVPVGVLPAVPDDWPADGDTEAFALRLLQLVRDIRQRDGAAVGGLYKALGIPDDPCGQLRSRAADLTERPFRLLHADIHRKNMILTDRNEVAFLDWELALLGDPVYDLADHLHKMSYPSEDRRLITAAWERAAPPECSRQWRSALDYYLAFEAVKSAVVDTVRWSHRIAGAAAGPERSALARELADKIATAAPHWDSGAPGTPGPREVEAVVDHWLSRNG
ncbi:aminoglycoside phosphotransferase family protein [Kitasatospora sp. NPDC002040]|uniref:phosphotransferase family protein n=1 Tax=Kitasatospora sp. NPDC002040 TaxID=3154661 RepID=UPI00332C787A